MERFFLFVPVVFVVFAALFVLVLVLSRRQERRSAASLAALAAGRGFEFLPAPAAERQELLELVEAVRFLRTAAGRRGARDGFAFLLRGEAGGFPFRFFRHTHRYARMRTHTRSWTRGRPSTSGGMDMERTTTWLLALRSPRPLEMPPVWFKQAALGDAVFAMGGLERVKLGRPEIDRRFHFFCDDREFAAASPAPRCWISARRCSPGRWSSWAGRPSCWPAPPSGARSGFRASWSRGPPSAACSRSGGSGRGGGGAPAGPRGQRGALSSISSTTEPSGYS